MTPHHTTPHDHENDHENNHENNHENDRDKNDRYTQPLLCELVSSPMIKRSPCLLITMCWIRMNHRWWDQQQQTKGWTSSSYFLFH
mmetsp:Transcript_32129/g.36846  ORF Transcript_32129/g.36846 Transcript_32129/m.36846 type:complete len:86 (+) Transcript_32129:91-348(+)